ncbi:GNAT family N-acetyltransferase [Bacillus sp. AR8-1]|uniref:GNAT family N-acetyltransferase n=1 Tax=Bacillus cereus group TaxID=86661 RepID=UPI0011CC3045|nr:MULTISPECIES: GNAT family N-acetyltransferase [Bacillus cereus group]MCM3222928.1 GNAT family N-acetyltransferase [Bacillus cereus]MEC3336020.1 GNAT family N-acetyltransferase [Bacillus cereus]TXR72716.1 GNAT family N-acetyltransferase [Bacillus sp. AR8-1]
MKLLSISQKHCPPDLKEQISLVMHQTWPEYYQNNEHKQWPDTQDTNSISLVLVENNVVISHVGIPSKYIKHHGENYKAFGLSEVMTNPAYRKQGYGLKLIKEAALFIERNTPDISIFTCEPSLVHFYSLGGWNHIKNTNVIGGTKDKPFRSDSLGLATMIRFHSSKAEKNRFTFEQADIYLELNEGMLW